jgi:hypothetical protein
MTMVRTKHTNRAKVGETIGIPLGMIFKTAVTLERVFRDREGRLCGSGTIVKRDGFSEYGIGRVVSIYL